MPITIIAQSAQFQDLEPNGPVGLPLSEPACETRSKAVALEGAGENRSGIWECSPGRYERQVAEAEVMHILAGACSFTPTGGETRQIRAGDTVFFPARTTGVWDIRETLRKVYVIMK